MWLREISLKGLRHRLQSLWPCLCQEGIYPVAFIAVKPGADEDHQEKCLSQLYDHMPEGLTPLATLKNGHQRRLLGTCRLSCSRGPGQVPGAGLREQGVLSRHGHRGSVIMRHILKTQQASGTVFSQVL